MRYTTLSVKYFAVITDEPMAVVFTTDDREFVECCVGLDDAK